MMTAEEMSNLFDSLKNKYKELGKTQNYDKQLTRIIVSPDNTCAFLQNFHGIYASGSIILSPKEITNLIDGATKGETTNGTIYTLKLDDVITRLHAISRIQSLTKFLKDNP